MQTLIQNKNKNLKSLNLQDMFLNQARKENIPVSIYLTGGIQLKGVVKGFDSFTILLEPSGKPSQLVYKHSIASIAPSKPIRTNRPQDYTEDELGAIDEDKNTIDFCDPSDTSTL